MTKNAKFIFVSLISIAFLASAAPKDSKKPAPKPVTKAATTKTKPAEVKKAKPVETAEESSGPKIKKIEFSGVKRTPQDILKRISNKYFGNGLYGTWTEDMLAEIRNIPIVREANLMRDMTGNITIQIKEREPIAYLYLDQYYWMDEQANVILPIETSNLEDKVFFSGPWKNLSEYIKKKGPETVMDGIHFYSQLLSNEFEEKKISEIHFDANLGWIMYRIESRAPIVFGTENLPQKIERFMQVVPQLGPMETSISRIDADFNDRVVVKLASPSKEVTK